MQAPAPTIKSASAAPPRKKSLSTPAINFLLDAALLLSFLTVLLTAGIQFFIFPPATRAAGWTLWSYSADQWAAAHHICLAIFAVGILLHLILHWVWIMNFITSRIGKWRNRRIEMPDSIKTLYGVGTLIALLTTLGLILAVAAVTIRPPHP